jgi:hypothetical protein
MLLLAMHEDEQHHLQHRKKSGYLVDIDRKDILVETLPGVYGKARWRADEIFESLAAADLSHEIQHVSVHSHS